MFAGMKYEPDDFRMSIPSNPQYPAELQAALDQFTSEIDENNGGETLIEFTDRVAMEMTMVRTRYKQGGAGDILEGDPRSN